jgi:hypothetical protein
LRPTTFTTEQKFGLLTVVGRAKNSERGHAQWLCTCECGGTKDVVSSSLKNGRVTSCGCLNHLKGENSPSWKGGKVDVRCANPLCGKMFEKQPSLLKPYKLAYCSNECRHIHAPYVMRGENHFRYKEKIKVNCSHCKKEMEILPCHATSYKNHFCKGTDCHSKWMEENQKGATNPNWKNGISYEPYPAIFVDKRFKAGIKERDNFTCQNPECPKTDSVLVIHHIDYVKSNCEPENLITLCNNCNSKANANREFWQAGYSEIIRLKYESIQSDRQIRQAIAV